MRRKRAIQDGGSWRHFVLSQANPSAALAAWESLAGEPGKEGDDGD